MFQAVLSKTLCIPRLNEIAEYTVVVETSTQVSQRDVLSFLDRRAEKRNYQTYRASSVL